MICKSARPALLIALIPLGLLVLAAGLSRVEFLVDGLVEQQFVPVAVLQEGDASFHWFSSAAGEHHPSVIAYDLCDRPSVEAAVQVNVQAAGACVQLATTAQSAGIQITWSLRSNNG